MATQPQNFPDDSEPSAHSNVRATRHNRWSDDDDDEEIIELDQYIHRHIQTLRRRWLWLLAGAIVGGAVAFGITSHRPLTYEGVTTLLVVPPSQPNGAPINPATFRAIVENVTLASQVVSELKLQDTITPQGFVERALSVEEVRGTNIVKVKVTLADAGMAADASRRLAAKAIALTQQVNQQEGASIQDQLKNHLNDAHDRLEKTEKELLAYKQSAQVELIKEDTDAQLRERSDLLRLVVEIESERARLAAAEQEIKRQQPLLSAARIPSSEEALQRTQAASTAQEAKAQEARAQQARAQEARAQGTSNDKNKQDREKEEEALRRQQAAAKGEVDAQHLDLTNPYVNPVYQTLDFQIATSRTRIAALERERDELINVKKLGGKELTQLSDLYRRQIELARLQANFDLATRVYGDLALRYEQSRTQPFGTTAQLQVVDSALPPDHPVSRKRLQYATLGSALGLLAMGVLVLFWETRGRSTPAT